MKNVNKKIGKVFVVCAIDTEGPIKDKKKPEIINSWFKLKKLIEIILSKKFRNQYKDSQGNGLVFSWFLLTLTGFKTNPFKRPMKYHQNYDFYNNNFKKIFKKFDDEIYWHYHQPAPSRIGNEWCRDWTGSQEYFNILARMVMERSYFPSCFRAGGRIEDNDLSNWLEQWIPFDFSNSSTKEGNLERVESAGQKLKNLIDWSKSTQSWVSYNPSRENYQKNGSQKRFVFRCLDVKSDFVKLSDQEIRKAFSEAYNGKNSVLSFFEHDRRFNAIKNIEDVMQRIKIISNEFKKVKWYYSNARKASVLSNNILDFPRPKFKIKTGENNRLIITSNNNIFGNTPFLCGYNNQKFFFEIPLNVLGYNKWITGPNFLIDKKIKKIAIAANSPSGNIGINYFKI
jgi:hypothetical protein